MKHPKHHSKKTKNITPERIEQCFGGLTKLFAIIFKLEICNHSLIYDQNSIENIIRRENMEHFVKKFNYFKSECTEGPIDAMWTIHAALDKIFAPIYPSKFDWGNLVFRKYDPHTEAHENIKLILLQKYFNNFTQNFMQQLKVVRDHFGSQMQDYFDDDHLFTVLDKLLGDDCLLIKIFLEPYRDFLLVPNRDKLINFFQENKYNWFKETLLEIKNLKHNSNKATDFYANKINDSFSLFKKINANSKINPQQPELVSESPKL